MAQSPIDGSPEGKPTVTSTHAPIGTFHPLGVPSPGERIYAVPRARRARVRDRRTDPARTGFHHRALRSLPALGVGPDHTGPGRLGGDGEPGRPPLPRVLRHRRAPDPARTADPAR